MMREWQRDVPDVKRKLLILLLQRRTTVVPARMNTVGSGGRNQRIGKSIVNKLEIGHENAEQKFLKGMVANVSAVANFIKSFLPLTVRIIMATKNAENMALDLGHMLLNRVFLKPTNFSVTTAIWRNQFMEYVRTKNSSFRFVFGYWWFFIGGRQCLGQGKCRAYIRRDR